MRSAARTDPFRSIGPRTLFGCLVWICGCQVLAGISERSTAASEDGGASGDEAGGEGTGGEGGSVSAGEGGGGAQPMVGGTTSSAGSDAAAGMPSTTSTDAGEDGTAGVNEPASAGSANGGNVDSGGSPAGGSAPAEAGSGGATVSTGCSAEGTDISGLLAADQTWTASSSPYFIRSDARVDEAATLTIEPGAEIYFCADAWLEVRGQIEAVGTAEMPVVFHDAQIRLDTGVVGQTYDASGNYVAGPRFEHALLEDGMLWVAEDQDVLIQGGGPYLRDVTLWAVNADFFGYLTGIYVERCRIDLFPDTVASEAGSLTPESGWIRNSYIRQAVLNGYAIGSSAYRMRNNAIEYLNVDRWAPMNELSFNTIRTVEWQRPSTTQTASLHNNSIYDPDGGYTYAMRISWESETSDPVDATGNYWGPSLTEEMMQAGDGANISGIFDFYDDFTLVEVDYSGFLTEPPEGVGPDW